MAYVPTTVQSIFAAALQGDKIQYSTPIVDAGGSPVDTSAWNIFRTTLIPSNGLGSASPPLQNTTATVGGSTAITTTLAAADTAPLFPGNYVLIIEGKPTSGDDYQTLVNGTLSMAAGA